MNLNSFSFILALLSNSLFVLLFFVITSSLAPTFSFSSPKNCLSSSKLVSTTTFTWSFLFKPAFFRRACTLAEESQGRWFTEDEREQILALDPERDRRVNDVPEFLPPWFFATAAEVAWTQRDFDEWRMPGDEPSPGVDSSGTDGSAD